MTRMQLGWVAAALMLSACDQAPVVKSELPFQPPVMHETTPADEVRNAPGLSTELEPGDCATQDDCGEGELCVADEIGSAHCAEAGENAVPERAPNGRPAAPVGLLDGQVMRDHAAGGGR